MMGGRPTDLPGQMPASTGADSKKEDGPKDPMQMYSQQMMSMYGGYPFMPMPMQPAMYNQMPQMAQQQHYYMQQAMYH